MNLVVILVATSLLGVIPGLYVMWLLVKIICYPLGLKQYFIFDEKIWSIYQRVILMFYETLYAQKVIFHGDFDQFKEKFENVLYISNHQSDVDWIVCDTVAARQGRIGRLRYVLKEVLKYVPIFGHYFYEHGCIYVDRGNFSENKAVKSLNFIKTQKLPCWLVIFPEGTRVDPKHASSLRKSSEFAEKHGYKPLKHHLFPRIRGTELIMQNLSDYLDAVYDITVFYEDCVQPGTYQRCKAPDMFAWFRKKRNFHVHVKRIPIGDVPQSGKELMTWMHARFALKDKIFDEMIESMKNNHSSQKNSPPHLADCPYRNWKVEWIETVPAFLGLAAVNVFLFYIVLHSFWAYIGVWIFGTTVGLVAVKYCV